MTMKFRNVLAVAIAAAALAASSGVLAGSMDKAAEKLRDQSSDQQSDQKSDQKSDKKPEQKPQAAPQRDDRSHDSSGKVASPRDSGVAVRGTDRGRSRPDRPQSGAERSSGRDLRDDLARLQGNDRNRGGGGSSRNPPPPRVVQRLPDGHRDYTWNGNRYYASGGHWYRPYGSSFVSIGIPFGLFVGTLPGLYTSFWFDGTRYFYADSTYYVYEPVRRGYVVTHSPYGDDDEEYNDASLGDDLYIYPARGQSEQQQADDRYACHRWAAQESHYDPLDDEYNADRRKDYQRAMTACLTGRGYTVN